MSLPHLPTPLGRRLVVPAVGLAVGATLAAVALVPHAEAAAVSTTGSCTDATGRTWTVRATWGDPVTGSDGASRVPLSEAGFTTTGSAAVPTWSELTVFSGTGASLQTLRWSGSQSYDSGRSYRSQDPMDPPSAPGKAMLRFTLVTATQSGGGCVVTLPQPFGTPSTPSASPTPTPTRSATPTPTSTPTPTASPTASPADVYSADVLAATNRERSANGLSPFGLQACVDSYANAQAARMAAENRMYHQELSPIMSACTLRGVGENVAYGYSTGNAVTQGWMNSPGHRANILNGSFTVIGIGAAQDSNGRWYACQVFGTPR